MRSLKLERIGRAVLTAAIVGATLGVAAQGFAGARDADGSRMQARSMKVGSTQRDSLMPPRDRVDWRSFKLSQGKGVSIAINHKPPKAAVAVRLTDSRGQELGVARTRGGRAVLTRRLEPGIYYISVSSRARVSYSLSLK